MPATETKVCTRCREEKPITRFSQRTRNGIRQPVSQCLDCHYERYRPGMTRWRKSEVGKRATAGYKLRQRYGISLEQYEEMFDRQDGSCAICLRPPPPRKKLGVDHDHDTGAVRGLLCDHCNRAMGQFGDSPELLQRAIRYLGGDYHSLFSDLVD